METQDKADNSQSAWDSEGKHVNMNTSVDVALTMACTSPALVQQQKFIPSSPPAAKRISHANFAFSAMTSSGGFFIVHTTAPI